MAVSVGAAQSYIEGVYGGPTEEVDYEYTLTTSATRVLSLDPERLAISLFNLGSNDVYLMFDELVSSSRGILVFPGGGFWGVNVRDDQTLPTREWYALTTTGASDVLMITTRRFALTGPAPLD